MKKLAKIIVLGVFSLFLFSMLTPAIEISNTAVKEDNIELEFYFNKPIIEKEGNYDIIIIDDLPTIQDLDKPCLPVKPLKILLPQGQTIDNILVETSEEIEIGSDFHPKVGGLLVPLLPDEYFINNKEKTKLSPVSHKLIYSNVGVHNCRGFSILYLNLYPVKYDSETGRLSYFENMKVIIETKEGDDNASFRGLSADFEIIENLVDNPSVIDTYTLPYNDKSCQMETYEYIIITSEEFKNYNGDYSFQTLIQSKIEKGMTAGIFTIEDIVNNPIYSVDGTWGDNNPSNPFYNSAITGNQDMFNDDPARIRNFIRHYYSEYGTEYVLLGGDADEIVPEDKIVPLRGLFANESGLPLSMPPEEEEDDIPSDVYYACLDGNFNYDCDIHFGECADRNNEAEIDEADLIAEVYVGRACVDSTEEIENFVMKTLTYEQSGDPYLKEILFIGEWVGFGGVAEWGGNSKDLIETKGYVADDYNINKFYDRDHEYNDWSPQELKDYIHHNNANLINHDGHGNHYYIFKTSGDFIRTFTNENYFFLYSHSCLTGSFDNYNCWSGYQDYDCIAEILTCEIPYGAYACILNSRFGLGAENSLDSPSGAYDESFYKALFVENIRNLGKASHWSKEDNIWRIDQNGLRWCYYQTNLFGDPELRIKNPNSAPNKPTITGPTNGAMDVNYDYTVTTTDPEGEDVYYWIEWFSGCPGVYWDGPYQSGQELVYNYAWENKGTHTIRVKAKDIEGSVSETATLKITIPRNKLLSGQFLQRFIDIFPFIYKIFQYFAKL